MSGEIVEKKKNQLSELTTNPTEPRTEPILSNTVNTPLASVTPTISKRLKPTSEKRVSVARVLDIEPTDPTPTKGTKKRVKDMNPEESQSRQIKDRSKKSEDIIFRKQKKALKISSYRD
jgi:hypothetical protein